MTNCTGPYATVEDFAGWNCHSSIVSRVHTGAADAASLTDSMAHFRTQGVEAGVGMILYNQTDGSQGVVTAVTDTNIEAALSGGVDNNWDVGDVYLIATVNAFERAAIERYLDLTSSDIASAVAAGGQCDCSITDWGAAFLRKLHIIDTLSFYACTCRSPLSDTERQQYRNWIETQLELIRTGKVDICGGPGSEGPAFGSSKEAVTPFARAQIIRDRIEQGRA